MREEEGRLREKRLQKKLSFDGAVDFTITLETLDLSNQAVICLSFLFHSVLTFFLLHLILNSPQYCLIARVLSQYIAGMFVCCCPIHGT